MPTIRVAPNQYYDQNRNKVFTVDHATHQIVNVEDKDNELPEPVIELIQNLDKELGAYVKKYFKEPHGHAVFVEVD